LHAEVPPQSWHGFSRDYSSITGIKDVANQPSIIQIAQGGWNKWGSELRIYIPRRFVDHPRFTLPQNRDLVAGNGPDVMGINKNDFWWFLVETLGFRSGGTQDIERITNRLPKNIRESFHAGASEK